MEKLPIKSIDLIKFLETIYIDKMVLEEMSEFERGKKAGNIEIIRYLITIRDLDINI